MAEEKKVTEAPDEMDLAESKINPDILDNKQWLTNAEEQIYQDYKEIEVKFQISDKPEFEKKVLRIYHPSNKEDTIVSKAYNEKFNELLFDEKYKTWEEMLEVLDKRGAWTKKDEDEYFRYDEITSQWAEEIVMAEKTGRYKMKPIKKEGISKLKERYYDDVRALIRKHTTRYKYYAQSVESLAHFHVIEIQLIYCVKHKVDDKWIPVWTSESLREDFSHNGNIFQELLREAMVFWRGISKEVLQKPPEETQGEENLEN